MKFDAENYDWQAFEQNVERAKEIRKHQAEARNAILDALLRYKKKKTNARIKKEAADMALAFKDLEDYASIDEIHNAYGYDIISESECKRLMALWEAREKYVTKSGEFSDEVTMFINQALNAIGGNYLDFLDETDAAERYVREEHVKRKGTTFRREEI